MRPDDTSELLLGLIAGERLPQSRVPVDRRRILQAAEDHGLLWQLSQNTSLDSELHAEIKDRSLLVVARNLALAGELRECLRGLREAGIECVPIRGISLIARIYGDIVARPIGDIDFLVHRSQVDHMRDLMLSRGYREIDRRPGFSDEFSYSLKFLVDRQFTILVEPHFSIAYPPASGRLDMDEVWSRCSPAVVAGEPTLRLGTEDLILHLVLHIAHRDDPPLVWLWEADWLLRRQEERLDWTLIIDTAHEIGVEGIVSHVIGQLQAVLYTPVPNEVCTRLQPCEEARRRSLSKAMAELSVVPEREGLAQLLAISGWRRKARYLTALLLPTPAFMMEQYDLQDRWRLPCAYIRRATRFGREGARGVARLFLSRRGY